MKAILALDPATVTGWARNYGKPEDPKQLFAPDSSIEIGDCTVLTGVWKLKVLPAAPTKGRKAEPTHERLFKMWDHLETLMDSYGTPELLVMEDSEAVSFKGKKAGEASHQFRAVVLLWCRLRDVEPVQISPNDLKRYGVGKGKADKGEMIEAAQRKYGYAGNEDNEADALHALAWGMEFRGEEF
jgi:Holliday junction resolvasome RuvABC endonuclease subunit